MCRSIKPLFYIDPSATEEEIRAAALQFVRKVSGYRVPSKANEVVFNRGVDEIAASTRELLKSLSTNVEPRHRLIVPHEHKSPTI